MSHLSYVVRPELDGPNYHLHLIQIDGSMTKKLEAVGCAYQFQEHIVATSTRRTIRNVVSVDPVKIRSRGLELDITKLFAECGIQLP